MIKNYWIKSKIVKEIKAFLSQIVLKGANIDDVRDQFKAHFSNRKADVVEKQYWVWMMRIVKYEFVVDGVVYTV